MSIESRLQGLTGDIPPGLTEGVALGTGLADGYDFYDSAIGQVVVTFNTTGVTSLDLADGFQTRYEERFGRALIRAEAPPAWRGHIPEAIERGSPGRLPVDLRKVTDFQQQVLLKTATIPKGEVRPYGWVAYEVARPGAVRAVGSAVARNPIPLIIPCHRVVRSDGHIGNYSLGGAHYKHDLLQIEGAEPDFLEELASHRVRVRANTSTGVYCHPTCRAIRRSMPSNVIDFRSVASAETAGYQPCKLCRPIG
ncbi:MAG TPA: methylated-DNA--[protein]-cysteine S-methyltransferase [Acidimicrobiia bacterium]|nr:methylated-DNA--[protein]-cysteine S-methyltransferase [Acidimicrobiia bacterium]